MQQTFALPLMASIAAAAVTVTGIAAIRRQEAWALKHAHLFASFAAGVLVAVSFLHVVPRALGLSASAPVFLLVGFVAMYLFNRLVTAVVCDKPATQDYAIGLVPLAGIGIHSFIDGIIYVVTFSVGTLTGVVTALGMVLHEFPEGIFTYVLLRKSGIGERASLWSAIAAAALTTPLGALAALPVVARIDPTVLACLLALSAGALIYVGASHLLPMTEREPHPSGLAAFGAGILLAVGIIVTHA